MSVEIDPVELGFRRPLMNEVSQILRIRNPNPTPVAFKVKTTAPKQYCVRPNSGRVEPGKEVEVTVLLQAMKQEPPLEAKCRDKFLVQSVAITADKEFANTAMIWQHVDDAERSSVQEKKIRVIYLPAEGSVSGAAAATPLRNGFNGSSGTYTPDPPAYSDHRSPSPQETFTPDTRRTSAAPPANAQTDSSTASSAAAAAASVVPLSYDEMKNKLAESQATISKYAQESNLRLRKVAKGETDNATINNIAQKIPNAQGVPLQIVAALCLGFLLGGWAMWMRYTE